MPPTGTSKSRLTKLRSTTCRSLSKCLPSVAIEDSSHSPSPPLSRKRLHRRLTARRLVRYVGSYLDSVHLVHDREKRVKLQAKLLAALTDGVQDDDGTYKVVGLQ